MVWGLSCLPLLSSSKHSHAGWHLCVFTAHPKEQKGKRSIKRKATSRKCHFSWAWISVAATVGAAAWKDSKLDKSNQKLPTAEGMWKATYSNGMLGICLRAAGGAVTQHPLESIQPCAKQVTWQEISHTQNRFDLRILFQTSRTNEVIIYKFFCLVNAFWTLYWYKAYYVCGANALPPSP